MMSTGIVNTKCVYLTGSQLLIYHLPVELLIQYEVFSNETSRKCQLSRLQIPIGGFFMHLVQVADSYQCGS